MSIWRICSRTRLQRLQPFDSNLLMWATSVSKPQNVCYLRIHDIQQTVPGPGPRQTANFPPIVVRRQTMITAPLSVQRDKIQAKVQVALKQMVSQLFWEEAIEALTALCGQSANEVVQNSVVIKHEGGELVLAEFQVFSYVSKPGEPSVDTGRFTNVSMMFNTNRFKLV
jgi:hypothetical protein